jgi:hypothetical protein
MGRVVRGAKCPWGEMSLGRNVRGARCPWGEMSVGRNVRGAKCPWGEMSVGRDVVGRVVVGRVLMGRVVLGELSWGEWSGNPLFSLDIALTVSIGRCRPNGPDQFDSNNVEKGRKGSATIIFSQTDC